MELPQDLKNALDSEFEALSSKRLAKNVAELSDRYRKGPQQSGNTFFKSDEDFSAYAIFRMPATYAAVYSALSQLKEQLPQLRPHSLLDVGAGPGTASWAAAELFSSLENVTLLERESNMVTLGKKLASYSAKASIKDAEWVRADITDSLDISQYDLIIASYSLGELPDKHYDSLIKKLWDASKGALVIIEPGTPVGYSRIMKARSMLINNNANIIAPCPQSNSCPVQDNDWCHFSQRVSRSRLHKQVKSGDLSYEDEKFSYIAVSSEHIAEKFSRITRHPQIRKGHIRIDLCTPDGLDSQVITQKNKELYKAARDLSWGSTMPKQI